MATGDDQGEPLRSYLLLGTDGWCQRGGPIPDRIVWIEVGTPSGWSRLFLRVWTGQDSCAFREAGYG
jgi:hypothetical protein